MGKYGLSIDNLLSAQVVTAAGEVVTASPEENEDLFWALRGGAGNFGIVTSFEYQAHRVPSVHGGTVAHPVSNAGAALDFFRHFTSEAPDELTAYFSLFASPGQPAEKLAAITVCHCGDDPAIAERDLKPLRDFGSPLADTIRVMPYPVINTLSDAGYPRGALNYWRSAFFAEMGDAALQVMVDAVHRCPSPMSGLSIMPYLGAVTRVAPAATAFPHRAPGYSLLIVSQWQDQAETRTNIGWATETFEALRPYMSGRRYVNNLSADDGRMVRDIWASTTSGSSRSSAATTRTTSSGSTTTSIQQGRRASPVPGGCRPGWCCPQPIVARPRDDLLHIWSTRFASGLHRAECP